MSKSTVSTAQQNYLNRLRAHRFIVWFLRVAILAGFLLLSEYTAAKDNIDTNIL